MLYLNHHLDDLTANLENICTALSHDFSARDRSDLRLFTTQPVDYSAESLHLINKLLSDKTRPIDLLLKNVLLANKLSLFNYPGFAAVKSNLNLLCYFKIILQDFINNLSEIIMILEHLADICANNITPHFKMVLGITLINARFIRDSFLVRLDSING